MTRSAVKGQIAGAIVPFVSVILRCRPWSLAFAVALASCVNFHPLQKTPAKASAKADATAAVEPAWKVIGHSVQGRPLRVASYGSGPRRVLWVGGIHGNEREGVVSTASLPAAFLAADRENKVTLTILEDVNPDGTAAKQRGNANGVDLNRNFPTKNFQPHRFFGMKPLSQPESLALHDLILSLKPHLVIVAHSWSGDHFINFDGPARHLAQRFADLSGYPVRDSGDMAATPGSLGNWAGIENGIPVLTLEHLRGREPNAAWADTQKAILAVVLDA